MLNNSIMKNKAKRLENNRKSDQRCGRKVVAINMDKETYEDWCRAKKECGGSSLFTIKTLLTLWMYKS